MMPGLEYAFLIAFLISALLQLSTKVTVMKTQVASTLTVEDKIGHLEADIKARQGTLEQVMDLMAGMVRKHCSIMPSYKGGDDLPFYMAERDSMEAAAMSFLAAQGRMVVVVNQATGVHVSYFREDVRVLGGQNG